MRRISQILGLALLFVLSTQLSLGQTVTVFGTGLNNPRGLTFGPDGYLYVAEGGAGGSMTTTEAECEQVPPPVGPYSGGYTSRISKFSSNGTRTTVADGLPSSQTAPTQGSLVSGVASLAFLGDTLYAITAGSGCSHGLAGTVNAVLKINSDGSWTQVANLSAFQQSHPTAVIEPDDFEPDGTWYSMVAVRGALYAVEPNHGELDVITPDGNVQRVADISANQGHFVPTAIAYHGNFYVGNLHTFPIDPGSSKILKINPGGQIDVVATGLTTVLGIAFDSRDRMYVLENTTGDNLFPTPFTGTIVRIDPNGTQTNIVTGLFLPTGMTMGPDGNLYVSNVGFGPPPVGLGQVLKITLQ